MLLLKIYDDSLPTYLI